MAKALVGFVGGPTLDQLNAVAPLRRRVADLEAEVLRLNTENDGLLKTLSERVDQVTAGDLLEPLSLLERKQSQGGTSSARVAEQLVLARALLD